MYTWTENFIIVSIGIFLVWLLRIQWRHMARAPEHEAQL